MKDDDFDRLEKFISKNTDKFTDFNMLDFETKKKKTFSKNSYVINRHIKKCGT